MPIPFTRRPASRGVSADPHGQRGGGLLPRLRSVAPLTATRDGNRLGGWFTLAQRHPWYRWANLAVAAYLPQRIKGFAPYLPSNAGGTIWGAGKLFGGHQLGPWTGFGVVPVEHEVSA
jgi:hypothetical protein